MAIPEILTGTAVIGALGGIGYACWDKIRALAGQASGLFINQISDINVCSGTIEKTLVQDGWIALYKKNIQYPSIARCVKKSSNEIVELPSFFYDKSFIIFLKYPYHIILLTNRSLVSTILTDIESLICKILSDNLKLNEDVNHGDDLHIGNGYHVIRECNRNKSKSNTATSSENKPNMPPAKLDNTWEQNDSSYKFSSRRINGIRYWMNDIQIPDFDPSIHQFYTDINILDFTFFNKSIMDLISNMDRFIRSKKFYESKKLSWRHGIFLHGPPGTGKSTIVKVLGQRYSMPIYSIDLSSYDNESFISLMRDIRGNQPVIVLFEDFDCVFHGRENQTNSSINMNPLTFECFINEISGVESNDGLIVIITANDISKVDPAIAIADGTISRPGRIDEVVYVGLMEEEPRKKTVKFMLPEYDEERSMDLVRRGEGMTAAQFNELCKNEALENYWKDKNETST